jgi:hypothetical protein
LKQKNNLALFCWAQGDAAHTYKISCGSEVILTEGQKYKTSTLSTILNLCVFCHYSSINNYLICIKLGTLTVQKILYRMTPRSLSKSDIVFNVKYQHNLTVKHKYNEWPWKQFMIGMFLMSFDRESFVL